MSDTLRISPSNTSDNTLPPGHVLNEYRIDSVLGIGGFGVTYLATDCNLNLKVALKEYLPVDYAVRGTDHSVTARSDADAESFNWGLRRFLDEARTLATFHHQHIVRVMRFFEAHRTGYMVMEFVEGEPLNTWITQHRPLHEAQLLRIAGALLDGLAVMHNAGYLHRDIKPANVFIRADASPVLIDFGSARSLNRNRGLTSMVSPGYAPLEQYHAHGNQGPWTDLYALGGVLYWMVTGVKPVDAAARVRQDVMTPASAYAANGLYSAELLRAIDWALKPNEEERPQSTAEFLARLNLCAHPTHERVTHTTAPAAASSNMTTVLMAGGFEPEVLKRVETEAARVLGPIAAMIVRKAARKAVTLAELCHGVAQEIEDEKLRPAFLKKFAHEGRTGPPTHPTTQPRSTTHAPSISTKFTPEILKNAEGELARHIGAIAGVVVRHAAAKARDESELYLLIADEIQDPVEKKLFVRKAVTASRKPR